MNRFILISFLVFSATCTVLAQELFVHANVNGFVPIGKTEKKLFPVVHYAKDADPTFILGGFAVGASYFKPQGEKTNLKIQANLLKYTYWNEPVLLRDESNQPLGSANFYSVNYNLALSGLVHQKLSERFSVGTGVGVHVRLVSLVKEKNKLMAGVAGATNGQYKMLMPMIPVELLVRNEKMFYALRYEQGLLNRFRGDLAKEKSERFGLICLEVGRKI